MAAHGDVVVEDVHVVPRLAVRIVSGHWEDWRLCLMGRAPCDSLLTPVVHALCVPVLFDRLPCNAMDKVTNDS